jgi:hypothetical protein
MASSCGSDANRPGGWDSRSVRAVAMCCVL